MTMRKSETPLQTTAPDGTAVEASGRAAQEGAREAWLFYDGDCPFCSGYVRYVRLRDAVGTLTVVNLRKDDLCVDDINARGFNLDEGMVLKLGDS